MTEKTALQIAVAIAGLVPLTAGAVGAVRPELLALGITASATTHAAYLSGLLLGVGLAFWSTIPAIEKQTRLFTILTAIVALGGAARLLTALRLGVFAPTVTLPLMMELLVTPALCFWQRRIAGQVP